MTRRLATCMAWSAALLLMSASMLWAFHHYVGTDAPHYFDAGLFPCPFHADR